MTVSTALNSMKTKTTTAEKHSHWYRREIAIMGLFFLVFFSVAAWNAFLVPGVIVGFSAFLFANWFYSREIVKLSLGIEGLDANDNLLREGFDVLALVRECATKAGLPMPEVAILNNDGINAFATGRDKDHALVTITSGALETFKHSPAALKAVIFHELGHIKHNDGLSRNILMQLVIALERTLRAMAYDAIKAEGSSNVVINLFKAITDFCWMVIRAFSRINEFRADLFSAEMGQGVGLIQAFKIMKDKTAYKKRFVGNSIEALEEAGVFDEENAKLKTPHVDTASMSYASRLWCWMDSWSNPHTNKETTNVVVRFLEGVLYTTIKAAKELFSSHPFMETRIQAVKEFLADNPEQVTHQDSNLVLMLATQRDQRALAKHATTYLQKAEAEMDLSSFSGLSI